MTPNDPKLNFMHIKRKLVTQAMWKQIWYTLLNSWWHLLTSNDLKNVYQMKASKLQNYDFMYIKWKVVSNPGNLKIDIEYFFDLPVTSNDP